MRWQGFHIWRGKLPHWRAEGVTYYVTFRHSRPLDDAERQRLFQSLARPDGRQMDLEILAVLPEATEMIFQVREGRDGQPLELSDIVEKAKAKTGRWIIKRTGERFPPFYAESYDRILRDAGELEERFLSILASPVDHELVEEPEEYGELFVKDAPEGL